MNGAVEQVFAEIEAGWTVLELPRPPSVNRFMGRLGNKTPSVKKWTNEANYHLYVAKTVRQVKQIAGRYEVEFVFSRYHSRCDLDNCIKPLMDWLQRVELIENDRLCERLLAYWGPAPLGVKVRLRAWGAH